MIKAGHKYWAEKVFAIYIRRELKKHFGGFYVVNEFPVINDNDPLVITPNHISWWDGFFMDLIDKKYIKRKIHLMMLERELKKYPFFSKLGAYSIRQESRASIAESFRYTREVIKNRENYAVIYPQGEIEPIDKIPPDIKPGIKLLTGEGPDDVKFLPAAFRIEWYNNKLPVVLCRWGEPVTRDEISKDFDIFRMKFADNIKKLRELSADSNITGGLKNELV